MNLTLKKNRKNPTEFWNLSQIEESISQLQDSTEISNLKSLNGKGFVVKNGIGTWVLRQISISGNGFNSVVEPKGAEGNPTLSLNIGTGATQIAAGNHNHSGIYEPVITTGTAKQFWRGDKTWVDLLSTIATAIISFNGDILTYDGEVVYNA